MLKVERCAYKHKQGAKRCQCRASAEEWFPSKREEGRKDYIHPQAQRLKEENHAYICQQNTKRYH